MTEAETQAVGAVLAKNRELAGALLPILHGIQDQIGYIPRDAVEVIAADLNLSQAEVHGVITFYHDFRQDPPGRHRWKLCRAEACQARGAGAVVSALERAAGIRMGETREDGSLTLDDAFCLGLCTSGPAALLNGQPVAALSPARVQAMVHRQLSEGA